MSTQSSIGPIAELFQDPESKDPGYTDISEELVDEFVKLDVPAPPDEEQAALATTAHILGRGIRVRDDLDSHATGPAGYEGPAVPAPAQTAPGASATQPTGNFTELERQLPPV